MILVESLFRRLCLPAISITTVSGTPSSKDGWTITHDPLTLKWGKKDMFVDLGAERLLSAERSGDRIAVEIKTFRSLSELADLEQTLGQFVLYRGVLQRTDPDRELYVAVADQVWHDVFDEPLGRLMIEDLRLKLCVFDEQQEVIVRWIP